MPVVFGAISGVVVVGAAFSVLGPPALNSKFSVINIILIAFGAFTAITAMLGYLGHDIADLPASEDSQYLDSSLYPNLYEGDGELRSRVDELRAPRAHELNTASQESIMDELKTLALSELTLIFEQRFSKKASEEYSLRLIKTTFEDTSIRLRKEIAALGRRGNLNLVIGVVTTFCAILTLAYMVFTGNVVFTDLKSVFSHYIPRLTIGIFIEVFAFFFLRLYKGTLSEIKFYQNELTSLAAWQIALDTAFLSQDPKNLTMVIEYLVKIRETVPVFKPEEEKDLVSLKSAGEFMESLAKAIAKAKK